MGQLLVRDVDDEVIRRLKRRAAAHGRSTEAEHRAILEAAVLTPTEQPAEAARRFQAEVRLAEGEPDAASLLHEARAARR
ncbi:MAG: hypothetical protein K2X11_12310 [Acetobacteraceae bacterium]|nr:hypothetical protein [Acetobacteraceae bacterium]